MLPVLMPFLGACYSYTRVPVADVPAGSDVRVRISADEAERVRSVLGRDERVLEGQFVQAGDDGLMLAVPAVAVGSSQSQSALRQRIAVPHEAIFEVEIRRLDRLKTAAVAGTVAVAAGVVAVTVFDIGSGRSRDGSKGGNDLQLLVPFLRFPMR
ncbi:MAG: hypothetical protein ACRENI_08630 [Gemmatimonadaceae bacterium]